MIEEFNRVVLGLLHSLTNSYALVPILSIPLFLSKISHNGAQFHLGPLAIYYFTLVTINHRFTTLVLGSIQFTVWLTLIWSKPQINR